MYRVIISLLLIALPVSLIAQSNPAMVKLEKIQKLLEKDKIEPAEKDLHKLLKEYPDFGKGWDLLSKIKRYNYNQAKSLPNLFDNMTITVEGEDGEELDADEDSLSAGLMELLSSIKPSTKAKNEYLYTLRKATLYSNEAYFCAIELRGELRAENVDTNVSTKALKFYDKAEKEFAEKNYNKAANFYKRAIEYQPDFYKAQLYLGDAYYFMEFYYEAIDAFKKCSENYPSFLEPRKFLMDAYLQEGLYDKAIEVAIASMSVYPDPIVATKLENVIYRNGMEMGVQWQARPVFPFGKGFRHGNEFNVFTDEDSTVATGPWKDYQAANQKIKAYANNQGLISEANDLTESNYAEVYAWEEMLRNNENAEELAQAKELQEKGYLDCFVLITCFHDDLYDQYIHFVKNNPEKVKYYFENLVIKKG